jgi:Leucine-rich repeat (LRR) protein
VHLRYFDILDNSITSFETFATWTEMKRLDASNNPITSLETFATWTALDNDGLYLSGCALTETVVNNILIKADESGVTTATIDLTGGTNAIPTGLGLTAYNNLIAKGNAVTVNGYPV